MTRPPRCPNFNHGRSNPPVRACPMCGEIVNPRVASQACSEEEHAKKRQERNAYCMHCGKRLAAGKP
jgi:hypothetical protein